MPACRASSAPDVHRFDSVDLDGQRVAQVRSCASGYDRPELVLAANPAESNRYHVIRRLAIGGMGEIFLARQAIAGASRLVVLKRLLPELAEDPQQLEMFVDEARIAANLAHPSIVQVHEFGRDAEGHFIVMEYVPGHHVGRIVKRAVQLGRELPVRFGAAIIYELARALDHAHNAVDSHGEPLDIVHRDISPSNVFVSFRGDVKLMDFGIARASNRTHRTNDGSIRGKFAYMAPEQIEGQAVDRRTDVYAAGIVLWELTLCRRLFDAPSELDTIRAALEQPIPRPSTIDPYYPPELEQTVMHALDRDPTRRPASAADFAAALKAYLRTNPVDRDDLAAIMAELFADDAAEVVRLETEHTASTVKDVAPTVHLLPAEPVSEPRRRSRLPLVLLALLVIGGGIATVLFALDSRETDRPRVAAAPTIDARAAAAAPDAASVVVADSPDAIVSADTIVAAQHPVETSAVRPPTSKDDSHVRKPGRDDSHVRKPADDSHVQKPPVADPPRPPISPTSPVDPPPAELVTIRLGLDPSEPKQDPSEPKQDVHVESSFKCTGGTLQTRCNIPPGSHRLHFRVTGGVEFDVPIEVRADRPRCFLQLTSQHIHCEPP
jgi:serine/threonine protein kinase